MTHQPGDVERTHRFRSFDRTTFTCRDEIAVQISRGIGNGVNAMRKCQRTTFPVK